MVRRGTKLVAVALLVLAAIVSPVAVPIRMLIERRRRVTDRTEQVAPAPRTGPILPA